MNTYIFLCTYHLLLSISFIPCTCVICSCAQWSFDGGGIGSLVHGAVLKGQRYEASLSVWADGLRMCLDEPYSDSCTLKIREGWQA